MLAVNGRFLSQPVSGVQRFGREILTALDRQAPGEIVVYHPARERPTFAAPDGTIEFRSFGQLRGHLWEQVDLPRALKRDGSPPLLSLTNTGPVVYRRQAYTLHDVIFRLYPQGFTRAFRAAYRVEVPLLIRRSEELLTVSNFSACEISTMYGVSRERFTIAHNSASPSATRVTKALPTPDEPYFLVFGSHGGNKNFKFVVESFQEYRRRGGEHELRVVALDEWVGDGVPGIRFMGRISDADLAMSYSQASAFIAPSLYEGFDIPLLEAQASGCSVIASDIPVHREVAGDSVTYFNPTDRNALVEALEYAESHPSPATVAIGCNNAARFSWDLSATAVLTTMRRLEATQWKR